jgi:mannonate dehydratase
VARRGLIHTPDRELTSEEVWANLTYFLQGIIPAAEEAGVKVAAHPDDAPIPSFMGVARILSSLDGLQRLIDAVPSACNGLGFCQGTIASMAGVDMIEAIRRFGRQKKIFFAHFRNPRGQVPVFEEVFPDEGSTDMVAAVRAYRDVGYDGVIRVDHAPAVEGDTHSERTFAYQVGYFKGIVDAIETLDTEGARWHAPHTDA